MAKGRWLYNNLLTSVSRVSVSSAPLGTVGRVVPQALGGAQLRAQGRFDGDDDLLYEVEIDGLSAGDKVGQASFRWRSADGDAWQGANLTTSETLIQLSHGVAIKWDASGGDTLCAGDRWSFVAARPHGRAALLSSDPDHDWRSEGKDEESLTVDLGLTLPVDAVVLGYHNLSCLGRAELMADQGPDWENPAYRQELAVASPHLVAYPQASFQHWRLVLHDPASGEACLSAGTLFLGSLVEPSVNFIYGQEQSLGFQRRESRLGGNLRGAAVLGRRDALRIGYRNATTSDREALEKVLYWCHQGGQGQARPVWFHADPELTGGLYYGLPAAALDLRQVRPGQAAYNLGLSLEAITRRGL